VSKHKLKRTALYAAKEILEPAGFKVSLDTGAKHHFIAAEKAGVRHRLTFSLSPRAGSGDHQATENYMRQNCRALLRRST
jgi:hypothetical protein